MRVFFIAGGVDIRLASWQHHFRRLLQIAGIALSIRQRRILARRRFLGTDRRFQRPKRRRRHDDRKRRARL